MDLRPSDIKDKSNWVQTTHEKTLEEEGTLELGEYLVAPIEALTDEDGSGVFESLAATVRAHLQEEFDTGRITGSAYTNVCIGALQAIQEVSNKFLFNQQLVHQLNTDIAKLRQETITEQAKTDDNLADGQAFNFRAQPDQVTRSKNF